MMGYVRAIATSTDAELAAMDRNDILDLHRTLSDLRNEVEALLERLPFDRAVQ